MKSITRVDLCIMDTEGKPLASTMNNTEGLEPMVAAFADSPADSQVISECQFFKVYSTRLYVNIRRLVANHEDANDILQETFMR